MSNNSHGYWIPAEGLEGWRALLADPEKHWVVGRSARTLAACWEGSDGWPVEVAESLRQSDGLEDLQILFGFRNTRWHCRVGRGHLRLT